MMSDTLLYLFDTDGFTLAEAWLLTYVLHSSLLLVSVWLLVVLNLIRSDQLRELAWKFALLGGLVTASVQVTFDIQSYSGNYQFPLLSKIFVSVIDINAGDYDDDVCLSSDNTKIINDTESTFYGQSSTRYNQLNTPTDLSLSMARDPESPNNFIYSQEADKLAGESLFTDYLLPESVPNHGDIYLAAGDKTNNISADAEASFIEPEYRYYMLLLFMFILAFLQVWKLVRLIVTWVKIKDCLSTRQIITEGIYYDLLSDLCKRSGVKRQIRLSQSDEIIVPVAFGIFTPEICIPIKTISCLSVQQQEIILAHELAHLVRHDPIWLAIGHAIDKIMFFQPLNRLATRGIQEVSEYASDLWAVNISGCNLTLAKCLTDVADWFSTASTSPVSRADNFNSGQVAAMARNHTILSKRIIRLLDGSQDNIPAKTTWWYPWRYIFVMCISVLLLTIMPGVTSGNSSGTSNNYYADGNNHPDPHATIVTNEILPESDTGTVNIHTVIQQLNAEVEFLKLEVNALKVQLNNTGLQSDDVHEMINLLEIKLNDIKVQHSALINYENNISWPEMFFDDKAEDGADPGSADSN